MTDTMRVTVHDRFREAQAWGCGHSGIPLRTVEIATVRPKCGGPRGEPRLNRYCEDGEFYDVHNWTNPCGHVDMYSAVLREAGVYSGQEAITNGWAGPGWKGTRQSDIRRGGPALTTARSFSVVASGLDAAGTGDRDD